MGDQMGDLTRILECSCTIFQAILCGDIPLYSDTVLTFGSYLQQIGSCRAIDTIYSTHFHVYRLYSNDTLIISDLGTKTLGPIDY